jgi:hypothetical protein
MAAIPPGYKYKLKPSHVVILLHHVIHSDDANNDADRTKAELIREIDNFRGYISRPLLESALYCCNMESERENFWHPRGWSFEKFLRDVIPNWQTYNFYYGSIFPKEANNGSDAKTGR